MPQDIVGIGHSCIVGKAIAGDNNFCRSIFGHLLHVLSQTDQQQAIIAHVIDGLVSNRYNGPLVQTTSRKFYRELF